MNDTSQWYTKFLKAKQKQPLEEVVYYVLPIKLTPVWKVAIAEKTEKCRFSYYMLSGLRNTSQMPVMMLIDADAKQPIEYSLIHITRSFKDFLVSKDNEAEYVLIVESYEQLDPQYLYVDVPFEKRVLQRFIKENMIDYEDIASSFQSVLSSSPYVINDKGGISLASFSYNTPFSKELILTMQTMQPPEFSLLQLPKKVVNGISAFHRDGIKFHLAERHISGSNFFQGFSVDRYHYLSQELIRRAQFPGEYSIFCSITPLGEGTEFLHDILTKFVRTEITHPFNFDESKEYWDVDLQKTQRMIDEDLWLQVVSQRQLTPTVHANFFENTTFINKMKMEWQIILERMNLKKGYEQQVSVLAKSSLVNTMRICQSIARDLGENKITEEIFNKGWHFSMSQADKLVNIEHVQRHMQALPQHYETNKFKAVRAELGSTALDLEELYRRVSHLFVDKVELQSLLDKLRRDGNLYCPRQGFYRWI